jgi:hypothetical protein
MLKLIRCALAPALCFAFAVMSPSITPSGLSLVAPAQAQASDALVRKCRKAVFDKYGQRKVKSGRKVRSISVKFSIAAVDACVANGGRVM